MKADPSFKNLPKRFWALVRLIGQECGYTHAGRIVIPTRNAAEKALQVLGLSIECFDSVICDGETTWDKLNKYFSYRSDVLHNHVQPNLMTAAQAKDAYTFLKGKTRPSCPQPTNKQKGKKKAPAYLTCMVNMLIEKYSQRMPCDYDPRTLTMVSGKDGTPLRTFARRLDGAFPSAANPVAVWEIKEYYYTTTFGSRVADGVYETLLDGMEIEELSAAEGVDVLHYLMVDAHYTWWECGKSYLCRIIDMLHMGYVDEVLFGKEVSARLPELVPMWCDIAEKRNNAG